jgi:hypothetical protein
MKQCHLEQIEQNMAVIMNFLIERKTIQKYKHRTRGYYNMIIDQAAIYAATSSIMIYVMKYSSEAILS